MKNSTLLKTILLTLISFSLPNNSYSQAGSLDRTFGRNGVVNTSFGNKDNEGYSVAIQNDGKILVAGSSDDFALVRYNSNGSLDLTFGKEGKVLTPLNIYSSKAYSLIIQSDGKIILAGTAYNGVNSDDFALVRYKTDGSLDSTFGINGKVFTQISPKSDDCKSIELQNDGKILVVGRSYFGNQSACVLVRYKTDGSLDSTFGKDGKVINFTALTLGSCLAIQNDGKIIVAGLQGQYLSLTKFNNNGNLDSTFGNNGIVQHMPVGQVSIANAVIILKDGNILVGGYSYGNNEIFSFMLLKYTRSGILDETFGNNGRILYDIGGVDSHFGNKVLIQNDGKIVVAGTCDCSIDSTQNKSLYFITARFNSNGIIDKTFGNDGKVLTGIGAYVHYGKSLAIQNDGKIIVAGYSRSGIGNDFSTDFTLVRYNNDITDIKETPSYSKSLLEISPNPFSVQTVLKLPEYITSGSISVFNLFGQEVLRQENISGGSITIKRENLPVGVYMVQISKANEIIAMDKLIIVD